MSYPIVIYTVSSYIGYEYMSDTTFYFTRYEIEGALTTLLDYDSSKTRKERERDILEEYIRKDGPIVEGQFGKWYFGRISIEQNYALGKFGKVYSEEPTTYDETEGDFIEEATPNKDADYSMFILDFSNNLLIYNTKNRIGHQQFREYFIDGFKGINGREINLKLEYIRNRDSIEKVMDEKTILKADFKLKPSNPSSDPEWENLDGSLQEMLAEKLELIAESKNGESLNMDEDLLKQGIEMAQTKCGIEYTIVYGDNGVVKTISKKQNPVQTTQERPKNLDGLRAYVSDLLNYGESYLTQNEK
jgi:hypothetical protein